MNQIPKLNDLMQNMFDEVAAPSWHDQHAPNTIRFGEIMDDHPSWRTNYYPAFPEVHRTRLNQKIEDRYFYREISHEGGGMPGVFFHFLKRKLNEVLPQYMKIYALEDSGDINVLRTETTKVKSRSIYSDYPQTALSGDADYATNSNDIANASEVTGPNIDMINKFNESYTDTDLLVLKALDVCFAGMTSRSD